MKTLARTGLLTSALILSGAAVALAQEEEEPLRIAGEELMTPAVAEAVRLVVPAVPVEVRGGTSCAGLRSAAEGEIAVGLTVRPPLGPEADRWLDLVLTPIGWQGLAVVVHPANPVGAMARGTVGRIYAGTVRNWREVGGADAEVVLVAQPQGSDDADWFLESCDLQVFSFVPPKPASLYVRHRGTLSFQELPVCTVDGPAGAMAAVAANPAAVAYVRITRDLEACAAAGRVKLLALDGVAPSMEAVAVGAYRLARPLCLATRGSPQGLVLRLLECFQGADGQAILERNGLIALRSPRGS